MLEISIVIPVFNSEDCLEELCRQIYIALKDFVSYEVILVNDQSHDNSWQKIAELANTNRNIKGINLRKNSGQDNALMAGLRISSGSYIVIMDDDLQHSPSDIPVLYEYCREKSYDVVYANFNKVRQVLWKNIGSWLNGKLAEIVIGKPKKIYMSAFKIITRDIVSEIVKYNGSYPYIDGLMFMITNSFGMVKLEHKKRFAGSSNYSLFRSFGVFMKLATGFSIFPLRIATYIGFFSSICGFLLGVLYILIYFLSKNNVEGWTTLVVLVLFIGGLILFSIGILGEYIGRSYLTINNRPQYVIKEIIDNSKKP